MKDNTHALLMSINADTPADEVIRIMREIGPSIRRETVEEYPEAMSRIWQIGRELNGQADR